MTQSSYFLTNGSSLEDCHTNFFALADLCGIKWRQYKTDKHLNDIDDPLVQSYINCLNADLMCVWRRTRSNTQEICIKELWIFWYGEEPNFNNLVSNSLIDGEEGSYEIGLSYECRTLLFKALHNLLERSLMTKGFARIGPWFMPLKHARTLDPKIKSDKLNDRAQAGFNFKFFLHGDSNVCTNVDLRRMPVFYPISIEDLQAASHIQDGLRVILAPYGIEAYLTGHIFNDSDQAIQKSLSDWKRAFPACLNFRNLKENGNLSISTSFNQGNSNKNKNCAENEFYNRLVEVIIGDFKAKYPLWFIFITEKDRKLRTIRSNENVNSVVDTRKCANLPEIESQLNKELEDAFDSFKLIQTPYCVQLPSDAHRLKSNTSQCISFCDSVCLEKSNSNKESSSLSDTLLSDTLLKRHCNCSRCQQANLKKQLKSNSLNCLSSFNAYPGKGKDRCGEKEKPKYLKNSTPFHHRSSLNLVQDVEFSVVSSSLMSQSSSHAESSSPINSAVNINSNLNQSNPTPIIMSYKSPVSTSTSSILNTPGIESSPLSNFNIDNVEHASPIASKEEVTSINTPLNILNQLNQSPKDKACLSTMSPSGINSGSLNNNALDSTNASNKVGQSQDSNVEISGATKQENVINQSQIGSCGDNSNAKLVIPMKRPHFTNNVYEGDNYLRNGLLYDFSSEFDWDCPPPKNRRTKDGSNICGYLIDLNRDFSDAFIDGFPEFKQGDPYEFQEIEDSDYKARIQLTNGSVVHNDVATENGPQVEGGDALLNGTDSNTNNKSKVENEANMFASKTGTKLTTRNDDEYGSAFSDIEFFNSSGDESNDNFLTPFTPKNMNGTSTAASAQSENDTFTTSINNTAILGPAELSRMFPTPPSLEAMVSSPCNVNDSRASETAVPNTDASDKERRPSSNLSNEESKDSFFVYKPPIKSSFITSIKYAPLENVEFCKHSLPSTCYYKHNIKKQLGLKEFNPPSQIHSSPQTNLIPNISKSTYVHISANKMAVSNSMTRNVRPTNPNMPVLNPPFMNRIRPPLNMQPQLFNFPNDNYRQNSPNLNLDGTSMSPMPNNFLSSPIPNFDNRKSPYPFVQVALNSPSNNNAFISNSPMSNYNSMQQKMPPMVGFYNGLNTNIENNMNANNLAGPPEINAIMFNLLLSDSMFNLYRDHNFDSCSICVCNMNIKGNDTGIYFPDSSQQVNGDSDCKCTCGFSALTNRHLSQFSGLFYEDEVEITNIFYDPSEKNVDSSENNDLFDKDLRKTLTEIDESFMNLLISLSTTIFPSSSTFSKMIHCDNRSSFKTFNLDDNSLRLFERDPLKLVYKDLSDVILMSLNITRMDTSAGSKQHLLLMKPPNLSLCSSRPVLHDWPFRTSHHPVSNSEVIFMLRTLQPLMQEAVQRKGAGNEVTYNAVKGPLTWRQFHWLAGRGTEAQCEPQPIPSLLAGYDKDCVIVSPFALKFWEKLSLEPYAIARDVGYVVLVPDNDYILSIVKSFFTELSTTYEMLRFGRHFPLKKLFPDGICVIDENIKKSDPAQSLEEWFSNLGESNLAVKIKLYAQACFDMVSKFSAYEKSLFESSSAKVANNSETLNSSFTNVHALNGNLSNSCLPSNSSSTTSSSMSSFNNVSQRPMNSFSHLSNSTNENQVDRSQVESDNAHAASQDPSICHVSTALQPYEDEDNILKYPSIVVYIVDPFAVFGKEASKLGCLGLMKSFSNMVKYLPENVRNNVHLQLLSIDSIVNNDKDFRNISRQSQMKELCFSTYSLCKQQLIFQPNIKSLTGLGPAASFDVFLKEKDSSYNRTQIYTTPFILAPLKDKQTELGEMFGDRREKTQVLFCCYCLSEDQKWLLVSCTNEKGDILQSKLININVPNRTRRRKASVRRFGLDKLMNFVQTVMSESVSPWRLVIGRLGRIGHGELKDWASLLSKKSLLKYSRQLRDLCAQCRELGPHDQPAIYSACLISLEADTALRVFPNFYTPDERFSSSCNTCSLRTPEDASCTHILVFPTSATTQSTHANFNMMDGIDGIGANLGEEFFTNLEDSDIPIGEDDIDFDIFNTIELTDGPVRDGPQPDSPSNRQSFGMPNLKNSNLLDEQDEQYQMSQQPLALAFYVSTARSGPLPRWFWANSPHLENTCPVFLKSALLIHTPFVQNSDDLLHTANTRDCHSLDSSLTTDVLRFVLEGYNSLSWLALDPATNDRLSCLPLHIQVLMQLYHSVQALI